MEAQVKKMNVIILARKSMLLLLVGFFIGCGGDAVTVPWGSVLVLDVEAITVNTGNYACTNIGYEDTSVRITALDSAGDPLNNVALHIHYPALSTATVEWTGDPDTTSTPMDPKPVTDPSGIYHLGLRIWCNQGAHANTVVIKSASATATVDITVAP